MAVAQIETVWGPEPEELIPQDFPEERMGRVCKELRGWSAGEEERGWLRVGTGYEARRGQGLNPGLASQGELRDQMQGACGGRAGRTRDRCQWAGGPEAQLGRLGRSHWRWRKGESTPV